MDSEIIDAERISFRDKEKPINKLPPSFAGDGAGGEANPPYLLVAADQPGRVQELCHILGGFGFPIKTVYEEGDALTQILAHRYDEHCLLIAGGNGSPARIHPANVVKRLRELHYRNDIHVCAAWLSAEEEAAYQAAQVDCRRLPAAQASLVEGINSLMNLPPDALPCLSVLQTPR